MAHPGLGYPVGPADDTTGLSVRFCLCWGGAGWVPGGTKVGGLKKTWCPCGWEDPWIYGLRFGVPKGNPARVLTCPGEAVTLAALAYGTTVKL